MAQLFYTSRLHIIGSTRYPEAVGLEPSWSSKLGEYIIVKQRWITLFICICSFATLLGGIGTGIAVLWVGDYNLFMRFKPIASVWGVSAIVADFTITVAMTYHLHRAKGGFAASDHLLDYVIQRESYPGVFLHNYSLLIYFSYLTQRLPDTSNYNHSPLAIFVCGPSTSISSYLIFIH